MLENEIRISRKEHVKMNNMIDPENKGVDGVTCTTDEDLAIKVRTLTKKYGKDVFALNGLNFSVQKEKFMDFLDRMGLENQRQSR